MLATNGRRYKIAGYARLASILDIRHALGLQRPVMVGLQVNAEQLSALTPGATLPLTKNFDGGHCTVIVGYDDGRGLFRVRNSWGQAWSDHGHFWLPYLYLTQSDPEFDCWSLLPETVTGAALEDDH